MVYGREVDGQVTTFGTTGYTLDSVFLLYDRLTRTVWYPQDSENLGAVGGPQLGRAIPIIEEPQVTTLDEWRALHPNTTVLLGSSS